jgi:hypothetical protein
MGSGVWRRKYSLGEAAMRIVWITLIIIAFGVGMFWLRRYMQR